MRKWFSIDPWKIRFMILYYAYGRVTRGVTRRRRALRSANYCACGSYDRNRLVIEHERKKKKPKLVKKMLKFCYQNRKLKGEIPPPRSCSKYRNSALRQTVWFSVDKYVDEVLFVHFNDFVPFKCTLRIVFFAYFGHFWRITAYTFQWIFRAYNSDWTRKNKCHFSRIYSFVLRRDYAFMYSHYNNI